MEPIGGCGAGRDDVQDSREVDCRRVTTLLMTMAATMAIDSSCSNVNASDMTYLPASMTVVGRVTQCL